MTWVLGSLNLLLALVFKMELLVLVYYPKIVYCAASKRRPKGSLPRGQGFGLMKRYIEYEYTLENKKKCFKDLTSEHEALRSGSSLFSKHFLTKIFFNYVL
ncbi:hypothetical protein F4703DRAFT_1799379 [Phycomyces blakesleeanus]